MLPSRLFYFLPLEDIWPDCTFSWAQKSGCIWHLKDLMRKAGMLAHAFPRTWEAEVGRVLWVWGQPGLHSKFQANQGYIVRHSFQKQNPSVGTMLAYSRNLISFCRITECIWTIIPGQLFDSLVILMTGECLAVWMGLFSFFFLTTTIRTTAKINGLVILIDY